jgi:hypothetical protein
LTNNELPLPWVEPGTPDGCVTELVREVGPGHPLFSKPAKALAVARDCDDVLFEFEDAGRLRCAVVHLTWSGRREHSAEWPGTQMFDSLVLWIEWMKAQHEEYTSEENPD